jgi:hypothetical protein
VRIASVTVSGSSRKPGASRRCNLAGASAIRARPAGVFGPVDLPPWKRQRALPGSALTWQQPPARVLAPQRSRPLRRFGDGRLDTNVMSRFYQ